MKLIFERSRTGRRAARLPEPRIPEFELPPWLLRKQQPALPEVAEIDLVRHYMALSRRAHGVDNGFYPLGSCTMKYNPKLNETAAALPGFTDIHPLQPDAHAQGALEAMHTLERALCEITGMDAYALSPAAGAHGEVTALMMIRAYHRARGDLARTVVLVPDSAHGTNPASAAMAGFTVVSIPSNAQGQVDVEALAAAADERTAALMLTNPNTVGLFERDIERIAAIVHGVGGQLYYDGANLNAVMGLVRPGDMGFDVMHLNLHKTFSTPHGAGGPGSGPVGAKAHLAEFLPAPRVVARAEGGYALEPGGEKSIGRVKAFHGNFLVLMRALTYILTLGGPGLREASEVAVLNANYLKQLLAPLFGLPFEGPCMHEFVVSLEAFKKQTGVSALDVSKALLDCGIHPPTMYFPLIVHEALMFEPTETESPETLDEVAQMLAEIVKRAGEDAQSLHEAPVTLPVRRVDEVRAARTPRLRYTK